MTHHTHDLVETLLLATREGRLRWRTEFDDLERDTFCADVGDDRIQIELLLLPPLIKTEGSERAFVRVTGLKLWEVFARGTYEYDQIMEMLSLNVDGWDRGGEARARSIRRAIERVNALPGLVGSG